MSYQSVIDDLEQIISDAASTVTVVTSLTDGYNKIDATRLIALAKDVIADTAGNTRYNNLFKLARIVGGSTIHKLDVLFDGGNDLYYANISPNISDNQKTNIITVGYREFTDLKMFHFKLDKEKNVILSCKVQRLSRVFNEINNVMSPNYIMNIADVNILNLQNSFEPERGQE